MIVGLVGCCGPKLDHAARARDLYVSPLFQKASAWADAHCDEWAIVSALRGVVPPDRVLRPYEARLPKGALYRDWQLASHAQLHELYPQASKFIFLAGADYACDVAENCPYHSSQTETCRLPFEFPLLGLGIGDRLKFFGRRLAS